jgi:hypothetical protein
MVAMTRKTTRTTTRRPVSEPLMPEPLPLELPQDVLPVNDLPTIDPEEYSDFIEGLEIVQVNVEKAAFERLRTPTFDGVLGFSLTQDPASYVLTKNGFIASQSYTVHLFDDPSQPVEHTFAKLTMVFEGIYHSQRVMNDLIFSAFSGFNLHIHLWPYAREFAQASTVKMGIPGLVLPHLKTPR